MRVLIRKNVDSAGAEPLYDFSQSVPATGGREHYSAIYPILIGIIKTEMEAVFNNAAHNYLDILITRKTV